MIIAIDGPAASGKGTLAKLLAAHFGYHHLDTGLLYRAVAAKLLARGKGLDDEAAAVESAGQLDLKSMDIDRLRSNEIGKAASTIAVYPQVRSAVLAFQREFAAQPPGAVLDGRDIGSFVCPQADVKFYVVASVSARARRRLGDEVLANPSATMASIEADIRTRDARDANRAIAPMKQADDAHLLDTTNLSIDEAFRTALEIVERARDNS